MMMMIKKKMLFHLLNHLKKQIKKTSLSNIFFKYLTRKFKRKICVNCDFAVVLLLFSLSGKILHGFVPKHVSALVLL